MADKSAATVTLKVRENCKPVIIHCHDATNGRDVGDRIVVEGGKEESFEISPDVYAIARPTESTIHTDVELSLAKGSAKNVKVEVATGGTMTSDFDLTPDTADSQPRLTGMDTSEHRLSFRLGGPAPTVEGDQAKEIEDENK